MKIEGRTFSLCEGRSFSVKPGSGGYICEMKLKIDSIFNEFWGRFDVRAVVQ